jgi:2-oxoglutarate dehydrogenase E2 component (dihydrolipoamide succinyltransferase)
VKADELIAKIETDKTAIEVFAPKAGVIEEFLVKDGSSVTANLPIIKLKPSDGSAATSASAEPSSKPAAATSPPPPPPPPQQPQAAKPAPSTMPEVPPVPKSAASATLVSQIPVTPLKSVESSTGAAADINKIGGTRAETRVKMSKMRQTVASRLKTAQNTCAMLTTFNECNMAYMIIFSYLKT